MKSCEKCRYYGHYHPKWCYFLGIENKNTEVAQHCGYFVNRELNF
ncbi:MAG: hypothetical protein ACE5K4_08340 [Candidatus Hydrothermarchaeota archaeon]